MPDPYATERGQGSNLTDASWVRNPLSPNRNALEEILYEHSPKCERMHWRKRPERRLEQEP